MSSFQKILRREYLANARTIIAKSKIDYGSMVEVTYDSESGIKRYDVLVLHPRLKNKTLHCLDLDLIDDDVFERFIEKNKETDINILYERVTKNKGILKPNIRIGTAFYETKIKRDKLLMKERPYKTLNLEKIKTVKYIPYEKNNIIESYNNLKEQQRLNEEQLNNNESQEL
jgi:hypothetical protein